MVHQLIPQPATTERDAGGARQGPRPPGPMSPSFQRENHGTVSGT